MSHELQQGLFGKVQHTAFTTLSCKTDTAGVADGFDGTGEEFFGDFTV